MSYQKLLNRCAFVTKHLSELPDVRPFAMTTTLITDWDAEKELQHELDALLVEISDYGAVEVALFAKLEDFGLSQKYLSEQLFTREELDIAYFKYPVLIWIYLRLHEASVQLFAYNSLIFYIGGELPKESFWRPKLLHVDHFRDMILSEEPTPFKKYILLGKVPYWKYEVVDELHRQVLNYHFNGAKPEILNVEDTIYTIYGDEIELGISSLCHISMRNTPESKQKAFHDQIPGKNKFFNYDMLMLQYVGDLSAYPQFDRDLIMWDTKAVPNILRRLCEVEIEDKRKYFELDGGTGNYFQKSDKQHIYFQFIVEKMIFELETAELVEIVETLKKDGYEDIKAKICEETLLIAEVKIGGYNIDICRILMYFQHIDICIDSEFNLPAWKITIPFAKKVFELPKGDTSFFVTHKFFFSILTCFNILELREITGDGDNDVISDYLANGTPQANMPLEGTFALQVSLRLNEQAQGYGEILTADADNRLYDYLELVSDYLREIPTQDWQVRFKKALSTLLILTLRKGVNPIGKVWADLKIEPPKEIMVRFINLGNLKALKYVVRSLNYNLRLLDPIWVSSVGHVHPEISAYIIKTLKNA